MTKKQRLNAMIEQLKERSEIAEVQKGYFQYCVDKLEEGQEQAKLRVEIDKLNQNIDLDTRTIAKIEEYVQTLEA